MDIGIVLTRKNFQKFELDALQKVYKTDMTYFYRFLFHFVNSCILQRYERRHEGTLLDMNVMELLDTYRVINLPNLMIQHMTRAAYTTKPNNGMPYGVMLTELYDKPNILLSGLNFRNHNKVLDAIMLKKCGLLRSRPEVQLVLLFFLGATWVLNSLKGWSLLWKKMLSSGRTTMNYGRKPCSLGRS